MCIHWWKIESPNGTPYVEGICKYCGESKMFKSAYEEALGINDKSSFQKERTSLHDH